jgi:hypothetical protein
MQAALKLTTRVLPGKRVEFTAPELTEGEVIEITVSAPQPVTDSATIFPSAADYLRSLNPPERTAPQWAAIEKELKADKDSWER